MTQDDVDDQSLSQLRVLFDLNAIFSSLGGHYWLRGGWAIDFLLGKITRPHEDLDLVTWVQNRERLEHLLVEGFGKQKDTAKYHKKQ